MTRSVGAKNKIPQTVKENIQAVFTRLGGTAAMADWAREHRTEFYKIYARLLPVDLIEDGSGSITIQIIKFGDVEIPRPTALELQAAKAIDVDAEELEPIKRLRAPR